MDTVLPAVRQRLADTARRCSPIVLIWVASLTLGLADVLYARLVPGPAGVLDPAALALAGAAVAVFCVAAGVAFVHWHRARRLATAADDVIAREAQWGIAQIEAWLDRQNHSRDG